METAMQLCAWQCHLESLEQWGFKNAYKNAGLSLVVNGVG